MTERKPIRKRKAPLKIVLTQSNDLSLVGLPFTEFQYNIWFAVVHELNNYKDRIQAKQTKQGLSHYTVSFKPENIPGFKMTYTKKKLGVILENTAGLVVSREYGDITQAMPIYTLCKYNWKTKEIEIGINPLLVDQLRQLKGNYTQYFFEEAIRIKGRHAKALYIALSCNEYKREWIVKIDELKEILNYPDTSIKDISSKLLKPFYNKTLDNPEFSFEYEPIYSKVGKTGQKKITSIRFYNIKNHNMQPKGDIVLSMPKEKLFEIFKQEICDLVDGAYKTVFEAMKFKSFDDKSKKLIIVFEAKEHAEYITKYEELIMDLYKPTLNKYFPEAKVFYTANIIN